MLCHLTTESIVLLRATTFTFRLTQKTCQFSTSRSHFYSATSEELPKQPSSKGRGIIFFNWLDALKSPLKVVSLREEKKSPKLDTDETPYPQLFTPSYKPVPSTSIPTPLSGPEHAGSSTIERNANPMPNMIHLLNELDLPGRYLALDCEMVGVGIDASESSLARVSLVNYHGTVILDEYVKQRKRVVDYRTRWSGIRKSDLINAKPFHEVQKTVIDLLDGRVLIGHAIHHDLKVLLLSHPNKYTRDTQLYAYDFALCSIPSISLKRLAKQELGVDIQTGEHSSVEDAKATMGIYRLHKNDWEKASRMISNIQAPEPRDLWNLDGKPNTVLKRRELAMRLEIDTQTGGYSSVMDARTRDVHRLPKYDGRGASGSVSQMRGPKTLLSKMELEPTTFKRRRVTHQEHGNDIRTGEHSSVVEAKAAMGIYRLHKNDWERGSGMISNIQAPERMDLWDLDGKPNTILRRRELAMQLEIDTQTGEYSRVIDARTTDVHRLHRYDGGGRSGSVSQLRGPRTVLRKMELEPTTFKRRRVTHQELGNDIYTGEHSSVVDARGTLPDWRENVKEKISQMRGPKTGFLRKMDLEPTTFKRRRDITHQEMNDIYTGKLSKEDVWAVLRGLGENGKRTISQMRGPKTGFLRKMDLGPTTFKRRRAKTHQEINDIYTGVGEHSSVVGARGTLPDWRGNVKGKISQMRGPKTVFWSKMDLEPTTFPRRRVTHQELGNDIQSGEHSSVEDVRAVLLDLLENGKRTISQVRGPKTGFLRKMNLEPTTFKGRRVSHQELGNDIQTGEHSNVVDSQGSLQPAWREKVKGTISQMREPICNKTTDMWDLDGESREGRDRRNVTRIQGPNFSPPRRTTSRPYYLSHPTIDDRDFRPRSERSDT